MWVLLFFVFIMVLGLIGQQMDKEKAAERRKEYEDIQRINEENQRQAIIDWNNGVCPDCDEEWVLDLDRKRTDLSPLCHCPKCNKTLYHVPKFVNYSAKWDEYHATKFDYRKNERDEELRTEQRNAEKRRNKMF